MAKGDNLAHWIEGEVIRMAAESSDNWLGPDMAEPAFDRPLVGFSSGSDPLYAQYVAHIGEFYLTPLDIFRKAFPGSSGVAASDLTVISWVLPATFATRKDQGDRRKQPAIRWARTRLHGEAFNNQMRQKVVTAFKRHGVDAVAPMTADFWQRSDKGPYAPCSNWSERHAAYAAGLGTFGLCDGLITPVGKAMRTGSVVAKAAMTPTRRPYTDHHAYCLHYSHGTCGKCIPRCPVNAINEHGHDKKRCMQYTEVAMPRYMQKKYAVDTHACGLCQARVPCMDRIPRPEDGL